jgi:hypothetical protein
LTSLVFFFCNKENLSDVKLFFNRSHHTFKNLKKELKLKHIPKVTQFTTHCT